MPASSSGPLLAQKLPFHGVSAEPCFLPPCHGTLGAAERTAKHKLPLTKPNRVRFLLCLLFPSSGKYPNSLALPWMSWNGKIRRKEGLPQDTYPSSLTASRIRDGPRRTFPRGPNPLALSPSLPKILGKSNHGLSQPFNSASRSAAREA